MAQRPKAKPKRKSQKNTDKEQSERFIETARSLGIASGSEGFERVIEKILPVKKRPKT